MQILGDGMDRVKAQIRRTSTSRVENFGNGFVNGLMSALEKVVGDCGEKCSEVGRGAGELAAQIFCAVSEEIGYTARFDGLRDEPNMICVESYKLSCESSFVSFAKEKCSKYARGDDFDRYYRARNGGCCGYKSR